MIGRLFMPPKKNYKFRPQQHTLDLMVEIEEKKAARARGVCEIIFFLTLSRPSELEATTCNKKKMAKDHGRYISRDYWRLPF